MLLKASGEETQIGHVADRLAQQYPSLPPVTVNEVVQELHHRFDGARVREFIPLFVERRARTALNELSVSYAPGPDGRHAQPPGA
jgi:hypothetical protein